MQQKRPLVPAVAAFALVLTAAAAADDGRWYGRPGWTADQGSVPTRLVHAIDGSDLGLEQDLPVDFRIGKRCIATDAPFRTVAERPLLRPGIHRVMITLADARRACRETLVIAERISVNLGDNLSLVAHQTDDGGIRLSKFNDDVRGAGADNGRATVRHTADAPAVEILVEGDPAVTNLENGSGAKLDVPSGEYSVEIAPGWWFPAWPGRRFDYPAGQEHHRLCDRLIEHRVLQSADRRTSAAVGAALLQQDLVMTAMATV